MIISDKLRNALTATTGFLKKLGEKKWVENAIFLLILAVFTGCATYVAVSLRRAIIPDEPGSIYMSSLFATTWLTPAYNDKTLSLGYSALDRFPFLFYWINGRLLNALALILPQASDWHQIILLRLVNVVYGIFTVVISYKLAREIITKKWWPLLVVFLLTNTLMFTMLSGGISYDNLTNLCAVAAVYFLVRVLKGKKFVHNSLLLIMITGIGCMVKKTFLPLALIMFIIWLIHIIRNYRALDLKIKLDWKLSLVGLITLGIITLNVFVYGVNLVKYRQPIPDCTDIISQERCDLSVFVRRARDMKFPAEKLTLRDVIEEQKMNPLSYFDEYWRTRMNTTIYGFMGHQSYYPIQLLPFYKVLYLFVLIAAVKYWKNQDFVFYSLIVITLLYLLVILASSYNEELMSDFRHVGVQGRYLFPVITPIYILVVQFFSQVTHAVVRKAAILYTTILFFVGGPLLFLLIFAGRNNLDWFV